MLIFFKDVLFRGVLRVMPSVILASNEVSAVSTTPSLVSLTLSFFFTPMTRRCAVCR